MSGLPHDTTQSELESWFTQFGGRPIAFWTLRTPDQHKPTGSGFAVFSSHEEASSLLSSANPTSLSSSAHYCPEPTIFGKFTAVYMTYSRYTLIENIQLILF